MEVVAVSFLNISGENVFSSSSMECLTISLGHLTYLSPGVRPRGKRECRHRLYYFKVINKKSLFDTEHLMGTFKGKLINVNIKTQYLFRTEYQEAVKNQSSSDIP